MSNRKAKVAAPCPTCAALVRIIDAFAAKGDGVVLTRQRRDIVLNACGFSPSDYDETDPFGATLQECVAAAIERKMGHKR